MNWTYRSITGGLIYGCLLATRAALARANPVVTTNDDGAQQAINYGEWVRGYRRGPLHSNFGTMPSAEDDNRAILVITAIEGDDLNTDARTAKTFGGSYRIRRYGCSVSPKGRVSFFEYRAAGMKGGGYPVISKGDLQRLKQLLANLPDDHAYLPPAGRRLVLQVPDGNQVLAKVYDRANMPYEVMEILRLSQSRIKSWALTFDTQRRWVADQFSIIGAFTLSPHGKYIVSATENGPIKFWNTDSQTMVKSEPLSPTPLRGGWTMSPAPVQDVRFSPDGSMAVVGGFGDVDVYDARTWKGIRRLSEIVEGHHRLSCPRFTPDGRFLLVQSAEPALRIFDTKIWEPRAPLADMPPDAVTYFPAQNGESAIYTTAAGVIALWNQSQRHMAAQLDNNGRILSLAFSPDQSLVAVVTAHEKNDTKVGLPAGH